MAQEQCKQALSEKARTLALGYCWKQGRKGIRSTSMSRKAIRDLSFVLRRLPVQVLM